MCIDILVLYTQDLNRQRETIVNSREKLHSADANIGKARVILADMTKRIMTNKLIMYGIIGFLVLCVVSGGVERATECGALTRGTF